MFGSLADAIAARYRPTIYIGIDKGKLSRWAAQCGKYNKNGKKAPDPSG